jgi:TetR/AcrR family transcriptional regulator, ethionamide resistance regulator
VRSGEAAADARRRRRTPEVAQAEIIAAAETLLRERPFRELTIDELMRRTGLSRPSFYVYFRDRHDLVLRVVEHLTQNLLAEAQAWFEAEGPERLRRALEDVVEAYARHGPVMRALADAAADDPDVEHAYGMLVQSFVDATAAQLREESASGRVKVGLAPEELAKALIWMGERYLYLTLGAEPYSDKEIVVEALQTVWTRTIYGTD